MGFDIEPFGTTQVIVRAVPHVLAWHFPKRMLAEALSATDGLDGMTLEEDATSAERLPLVLACKTAIRAGDQLGLPEMQQRLRQLSEAEICRTCTDDPASNSAGPRSSASSTATS